MARGGIPAVPLRRRGRRVGAARTHERRGKRKGLEKKGKNVSKGILDFLQSQTNR
jgi:hypothetical protein